jgi:plastocyanin
MGKQALIALALSVLATPALAGTYTEVPVKDGGTVKGTVTFGGKAPAPKPITVSKDTDACGKEVKDESLVVGKTNGLANAVVYLSDIKSGAKAEKQSPTLDQKACAYAPHVQATTLGSPLLILNSDPVLHNVHAYGDSGKGASAFNLAMPIQGQKLTKTLSKPGAFSLKCDAGHTWMSAFVHVFEHPYFAVTKDDGAFSLGNVPPGTYTLVVWHEKLGEVKQSVTVTASGISTSAVELK